MFFKILGYICTPIFTKESLLQMLKQFISLLFSVLVFFSSTGILRDAAHAWEHRESKDWFISADEICTENTKNVCEHQSHITNKLHECKFHFFYSIDSSFISGSSVDLPIVFHIDQHFQFNFSEGYIGYQPNFGRSRAPPAIV